MSRTKSYSLFFLGVASALGIVWLVRQRREETGGWSDWKQVLIRHHGVEKGGQLAAEVRQQHVVLIAATPMPENRALRWHLKDRILPGLALYRVLLQEHDGNQQAALAEVDEAFRSRTLAKSRMLFAPMKLLPEPFRVFKLGFTQMMKKFPVEGWNFEYLENSDERVAFNNTRCFYLDTLTAYGAPELTASFCKTDDVMAELLPPSIRFIREHTLGRGDEVCDFQYCKVKQ